MTPPEHLIIFISRENDALLIEWWRQWICHSSRKFPRRERETTAQNSISIYNNTVLEQITVSLAFNCLLPHLSCNDALSNLLSFKNIQLNKAILSSDIVSSLVVTCVFTSHHSTFMNCSGRSYLLINKHMLHTWPINRTRYLCTACVSCILPL